MTPIRKKILLITAPDMIVQSGYNQQNNFPLTLMQYLNHTVRDNADMQKDRSGIESVALSKYGKLLRGRLFLR